MIFHSDSNLKNHTNQLRKRMDLQVQGYRQKNFSDAHKSRW